MLFKLLALVFSVLDVTNIGTNALLGTSRKQMQRIVQRNSIYRKKKTLGGKKEAGEEEIVTPPPCDPTTS